MLTKPGTCSGCSLYEPPFGKKVGYVPANGDGSNGVLIVAEAAGEHEENEGMPLVGKSGYALFSELARVDIQREGFLIHNVLSCRPPDNKFDRPYIPLAVAHCAPNLDRSIAQIKATAAEHGKTPVILTLGVQPFKRVLGLDSKRDADLLKLDYYAYPFWSDTYNCWVYNAPHPAYLVRGKTQYWDVVRFTAKRALEVASEGLTLDDPSYLLDPPTSLFDGFVRAYKGSLETDPTNPLSYDIETPYKKTASEEDLEKDEEANNDHTIIRISFSYRDSRGEFHTTSVRWSAEYMAGIEHLFAVAPFVLGWNSDNYDYPRVTRYVPVNGISLDGMVAWHILNSSLDMGLGFVTPYYWQKTTAWKHLSDAQPAFYNAKDAHAALINYFGIKQHLIENRLWHVYERHWIELFKALKFMSNTGVIRDDVMRADAEAQLTTLLEGTEAEMEAAVPVAALKLKVYKTKPKKEIVGLYETTQLIPVPYCSICGELKPSTRHGKLCVGFLGEKLVPLKYCGQCGELKPTKKHEAVCKNTFQVTIDGPVPAMAITLLEEPKTVWAVPIKFKVSKVSLMNYQSTLKHQAIINRKEKKITFDADAINLLIKKYPKDPLYPTILKHRKVSKLLGTYIGYQLETGKLHGGMPVGPDGRIHTIFSRNASTLRFTSKEPNLQNLPRPNPKDPNDLANIIRNLVVAQPGSILYARDFSGIEAVLTGYFSLDPKYIRLAKHDVHTYYTVYALYELEGGARIKAYDLPDMDWPDDRLFPYLEDLKSRFKHERNSLYKHLVHAANFMQGAKGAADKIFSETGIMYPTATVQKVMDVYYALFPKIKLWHRNTLDEAQKEGYLRNPFGYVHKFSRVYDYKKEFGEWVKKPGADSNRAIAFKPQSTAVGIITEAILRLYFDRYEEAGKYLRLQVHDELLSEVPVHLWEAVDIVMKEEMERPVPELPLPASWGMGSYLNVLTEAKLDLHQPSRWGSMKEMK